MVAQNTQKHANQSGWCILNLLQIGQLHQNESGVLSK
jgi:hypothetical protein